MTTVTPARTIHEGTSGARRHRPTPWAAIPLALLLVASACSGPGSGSASGGASPSGAQLPGSTPLVVGLGYIPSVQFAPFYLAQQRGYYRDAGLAVTFQNKIDPDLVTLVGQGAIDIGIADGTSVIPAVSQGVPIRYVATMYATFPNVVYAKASSGIRIAADLRGRKLGTPGKYGSSWIMLEALLASANLTPSDLDIQLYPDFGQSTALVQGAVDAATGFANNEPVVLDHGGTPVTVLSVDASVPLPGNGLIAGTRTIADKHDALAAFVAATLRAMAAIRADPQAGLDASVTAVPELGKDEATQLAILNATIRLWSTDGGIDTAAWQQTEQFMAGLPDGPLSGSPPPVNDLVDTSLLS
jgi:NitT/TauT family transport system substrate-binding protein